MQFIESEVEPLRNMRYLSTALELEINEVIVEKGIKEVTMSNAKEAYVTLMHHFINRELEFEYT